ncbi:Hypothetical protein A7982_10307 [Minicystis rosea]|nr:Hypothetical protein A7982_10307 [Minicystis rosea]
MAITEAVQLAAFIKRYWEPADDRPGLRRVKARLPKSTADELVSLVHAVQEAQTKLLLLVDPVVADQRERAKELVDELETALEFLLDDDEEEAADAQLAQIKEFHADDGQRSATLVQALRDFAALAGSLRQRLVESDEDFDPKIIDEAKKLSKQLMEQPAQAAPNAEAVAKATKIRNQLLHLLMNRVSLTRRSAAHVFRKNPEIVREATSAYERRRRAANRRAKATAEAEKAAADERGKTG